MPFPGRLTHPLQITRRRVDAGGLILAHHASTVAHHYNCSVPSLRSSTGRDGSVRTSSSTTVVHTSPTVPRSTSPHNQSAR